MQFILGVIGSIIAIVSGIGGTVFETRQKDGRLAPWAYVAITGIVAGALVTQIAGVLKDRSDTAEENKRMAVETTILSTAKGTLQTTHSVLTDTQNVLVGTQGEVKSLGGVDKKISENLSKTTENLSKTNGIARQGSATLSATKDVTGRTLAIAHNVDRVMFPFTNVSFAYTLGCNLETADVSLYATRLRGAVRVGMRTNRHDAHTTYTLDGQENQVAIATDGSSLWPNWMGSEQEAFSDLFVTNPALNIYARPVALKTLALWKDPWRLPGADVHVELGDSFDALTDPNPQVDMQLVYWPQTDKCLIHAHYAHRTPYVGSQTSFAGIGDLTGALLVLRIPMPDTDSAGHTAVTLKDLSMAVGTNILCLSSSQLRKYAGSSTNGDFYYYKFPKDQAAVLRLVRFYNSLPDETLDQCS